jgi:hypothetical protein
MKAPTSAFLLLFRNAGPETHAQLTPSERRKLAQRWNDWYDRLEAAGKVQHGQPLENHVRIVAGPRGKQVIDGPFAEAKEVIGGYFYLSVADLAEATAIAKQCPGLALGVQVEIRQVAAVSPVLDHVAGRPPKRAVARVQRNR